MKKGWQIILGIVIVAVVLGGVCIGVGFLTGADTARIMMNLDNRFQLSTYIQAYTDYAGQLTQYFGGIL